MRILIIIARNQPDPAPAPAPRRPAYDPSKHSERCQERRAAAAAWAERWPNHCHICHGAGFITYSDDPSAAGVSLSPGSMEFSDPCSCVEHERCPRCGRSLLGRVWGHPRRHLASLLYRIGAIANGRLSRPAAHLLRLMFRGIQMPEERRELAIRRLVRRLVDVELDAGDAVFALAERISSITADLPGCEFCGWSGEGKDDVQPPAECWCYEEHEAELAKLAAEGSICWRCEQPFDEHRPGIEAKLPIFGSRWLHHGCLMSGDRLADGSTYEEPAAGDD